MPDTDEKFDRIEYFSAELYDALREGRTIAPLIAQAPDLLIGDAYDISLKVLHRRTKDGEKVIGKKIGVTSPVVQEMLGVHEPDFGFLTDHMWVGSEVDIQANRLIQPRAEAEIAFFLRHDLNGPGVTAADVLAATDYIAPCFEIVDSRIKDWKISIVDTVADNASCGVFVIGDARVDPAGLDLPALHCTVVKNGKPLSEGFGSAVQGSPLEAVAWLANRLATYGVSLNAGDVILSGSLVPLEPAVAGDRFEMAIKGLGNCVVQFR